MTHKNPLHLLNDDGTVSRRSFLTASALGMGGLAWGGLSACGSSDDEGDEKATGPFPFGWVQPTTGLYAAGYAPIYVSGEIAVEEINAAGGIMGREIERKVEDDEGDPAKEPGIIEKLTSAGVAVVLGPTGGSQVQASVAAAAREKIVQCAWTNDSSVLLGGKYPYQYGLTWNTGQGSQLAVDYLTGTRGVTKVAILAEDSAFGQSAVETTKAALADAGIKEVATVVYPVTATQVDTYVRSVLDNDVEGLFYWGANLQNTVQIFAQLDQQNVRMPIVGQAAAQYDEIVLKSPTAITSDVWTVGLKAYTWTDTESPTQRRVDYAKKLAANPATKGSTAINANAPYYDFPHLLKTVIEDIKSFEPEKIQEALDNVKGYDGMIGKITLTPDDHGGLPLDELALLNVASGQDTTQAVGGVFRERQA